MGTDWLRQLKERLDSGEWLTHTPEGEPEGILTGVFVDQTRRIVYHPHSRPVPAGAFGQHRD